MDIIQKKSIKKTRAAIIGHPKDIGHNIAIVRGKYFKLAHSMLSA